MSLLTPFNPNFGKVPQLFLDRQQIVDNYVQELCNSGQSINTPYQTTLIYGVRGSGKTSLLTDITNKIKDQSDWLVIDLINNDQIIDNLIDNLRIASSSNFKKVLKQINTLQVGNIGINLSDHEAAQITVLIELLKKLQKQNKKVLITIDEVASTPTLQNFAAIYQLLIRQELGIAIIMTGLPENISELQNNKVLTFLLRSNRIELSALKSSSIINAFQENFEKGQRQISSPIATQLTSLTKGYAYAFQLLGYLIWQQTEPNDIIDEKIIQQVKPEYQRQLNNNVYSLIYRSLSAKDREFIKAMANISSGQIKLADIAKQTQHASNYWSMYRKRLIDQQIIKNVTYGYVSFNLPLFQEFIKEQTELEKFDF